MFKAIVFDIGQTLFEYNKSLNWTKLYRPALESVSNKCGYTFSENQYQYAIAVLTKYNTRVNPRDYEVTSNHIFIEILSGLEIPMGEIEQVKFHFYTFSGKMFLFSQK